MLLFGLDSHEDKFRSHHDDYQPRLKPSPQTAFNVSKAIKSVELTSIIPDNNRDLRLKKFVEIYLAPLIRGVNCLRAQLGPSETRKHFPYQSWRWRSKNIKNKEAN